MALAIDDDQAGLAQRAGITCVPLIVLETFSDRDARTVADTYYWTRGNGLIYKWNGTTGVWFEPLIEAISPVVRGFSHMPDGDEYTTREGMRFSIDTSEKAGEYLWNRLNSSRIVGARVTIGSLLVDLSRSNPLNLSHVGRVHVVRWRGEVTSLPLLDADTMTFEVIVETEEVRIIASRSMIGVATANKVDAGKLYPVPIGDADVDALWFDAGQEIVLRGPLTPAGTQAIFDIDESEWAGELWDRTGSAPGHQILGGFIQLGEVIVGYTFLSINSSAQTMTINGISGRALTYSAGTKCYLLPERQRYAISAAPVSSIGDAFATTPFEESFKISDQSIWNGAGPVLENVEQGDSMGHVAFLTFSTISLGQQRIGSMANRALSALLVNVIGSYTVGTSPTVVWDNSAASVGDFFHGGESNTSAIERSQDHYGPILTFGNMTSVNTSAEVYSFEINSGAGGRFDSRHFRIELSVTETGPFVLELVINVDAAIVNSLRTMKMIGNYPGVIPLVVSGDWADFLEIDVSQIVAGQDFTIRFHMNTTTITDISLDFVIDDHTVNADIRLIGDWVKYAITPTAPAGNHPIDVVEMVVDDFLPTAAVTYDATTFAVAKTNTPGLGLSTDLSRFPTLGEFLAQAGFNSRINFLLSETYSGTELKAFAAETDYDFPAATVEIGSDYRDLKLALRPISEIANRFAALYDQAGGTSGGLAANYRKTFGATAGVNNLVSKVATSKFVTSEAEYGKRDSINLPFQMLTDEDTLIDVLGYYATEAMRAPVSRISCIVPWWIGYGLEAGDIVTIEPPWETSAIKARVTKTVFNFDENGVGVNLEEVT